jgi:hypothetical protein
MELAVQSAIYQADLDWDTVHGESTFHLLGSLSGIQHSCAARSIQCIRLVCAIGSLCAVVSIVAVKVRYECCWRTTQQELLTLGHAAVAGVISQYQLTVASAKHGKP